MRYENGQKVFYLLVLRNIYGCIQSALLWYNLFYRTLEGLGFEINTYDKCVKKKVIEGTQCTFFWYVDDNKLSYKNPEVISDIINEEKKHFGEVSVVRGKNHTFLGTNIEIQDITIKVDMVEQLEDFIEMFCE